MLKDNANTNPYSTHSSYSLYSKEHSSSIVDYSSSIVDSYSNQRLPRIRCTTVVLRIAVAVWSNNAYAL